MICLHTGKMLYLRNWFTPEMLKEMQEVFSQPAHNFEYRFNQLILLK
jgi:hypothetical protein